MITWIRGGDLIDPANETVEQLDVVVEKGKISKMLPPGVFQGNGSGIRRVEASGKMVIPGLVDMHVHLREPGREDEETIISLSLIHISEPTRPY